MIIERKNILIACLLIPLTIVSFAQAMDYPSKDIRFTPADYTSDHEILAITEEASNTGTTRWNTITIRLPEAIPYHPQLVLRGQAQVQSDSKPTHVGILLDCVEGEEGFAKIPIGTDGTVSFAVPASAFVPGSKSVNHAPLTPSSSIRAIKIYASFPQKARSTFTLKSLTMSYEKDWSPLEAAKRRNAHLLEGSMVIPEKWTHVHPRLFASADEIEETSRRFKEDPAFLQHVLPADDGPEMTGAIVSFEESVNAAHRNTLYLAKLAVAYRVTGNEAYLERLREWIPTLQSYEPPPMGSIGSNIGLVAGHVLLGCSIAYDVLAGQGDEELETALRDVILKQGERTFEDIISMTRFPYEQNHLIIPVCGLGVASMTLADSYPETQAWGVLVENIMDRALDAIAHDGWFFEGITYWNYTMQFPVSYAVARQRVLDERVLEVPCFKLAPEYLAHMTLPNPRFVFDFGDWGPRVEPDGVGFQKGYDWPWHTLTTRVKKFIPTLLLREDPDNTFLRDYISWTTTGKDSMTGIYTIDGVFEMLLPSPDSGETRGMERTYQSYPPYHYFPDMEVVHWRNNWEDPNATALAFKSGPPAGHHFAKLIEGQPDWKPSLGHAHPDAGSFILFGQGVFLANDTGYTGAKETANHNSILVDGIGQHKGGTAWRTFQGKPYSEYDLIHMDNVWMGPRVMAATAVYEAAYDDALQLEAMRRHLIMINGRFLVILDELSCEVPREYQWRWHSDRPAEALEANRYAMTNGTGRVVIESLNEVAESQVVPTIVETNIYAQNPSRPQQRGYHLALTSPKQKDFEFLTVACIQSASETPEAFQVLEYSDRMVKMSDGDKTCTVWFAGDSALDGTFAYVISDASGQVEAFGLSGKSLQTDDVSLGLKQPSQIIAERDAAADWVIEANNDLVAISVEE